LQPSSRDLALIAASKMSGFSTYIK
jgi:hypothetical protein